MIFFVGFFFLSDLLRNILKCNCRPYSTLMARYDLLQYYAAMYYKNSSMRKVQLMSVQKFSEHRFSFLKCL